MPIIVLNYLLVIFFILTFILIITASYHILLVCIHFCCYLCYTIGNNNEESPKNFTV